MSKNKKILSQLNPLVRCRQYKIPLWQCPHFLFLVMGLVIIGAIIATYFIATLRVGDPTLVSLVVLLVGAILLAINFVITNSFERIAEANRMKTEFIGIVSHQLRAPLTNLRFSLDFLLSGKLGETSQQQVEHFSILKENTHRMGDLVDNLLTVSRLESGEFPLKEREVSLEEVTRSLILKSKPLTEASNVKVLLDASKGLPNVTGDPLWLEQVVENLLDNAIRYSKGGGEVKIKIRQKKKKVYFEVQDAGLGIPKEEQKYIFEKFFRSRNALKHQTNGSGLGLHIAKRVVKLLDGKIGFSSEENKGSTFWFTLPIK